jgi:hypothetical protein
MPILFRFLSIWTAMLFGLVGTVYCGSGDDETAPDTFQKVVETRDVLK